MTRKIAIVGAFGIGSIGDEAGLDAFVRAVSDFASVTVLMRNPTEAYARQHGVLVHHKLEHTLRSDGARLAFRGMNGGDDPEPIEAILRLFTDTDLVVLGPGDFFNEDTGQFMRGALPEMALMAWLAEMAGTPYMVYAASARELRSVWAIAQASYIVSHAAAVTIRDRSSKNRLVSAGVRGAWKAVVCDDPVRATKPRVLQEPINGRLGLSVRWVGYRSDADNYARIVSYIATKWTSKRSTCSTHADEVYTIPMFASGCGYQDDRETALQLAPGATHIESIRMTPADALYHWSSCERALTTRLHAAVMCYSLGIPFVALAYEPKVAGFCDTVGATWFPLSADPEEVRAALYSAQPLPVTEPNMGRYREIIQGAACRKY